jgi:hypothetical protein
MAVQVIASSYSDGPTLTAAAGSVDRMSLGGYRCQCNPVTGERMAVVEE